MTTPTGAAAVVTSPDVSPAQRAGELLRSLYGSQLAAWTARYAEQWRAMPGTTWAAERDGDAWKATFALTGPKGQRVEAEWNLRDTPIDRAPTAKERASGGPPHAVEASNAVADRLIKYPPATPAAGPVSLVTTITRVAKAGRELTVTLDQSEPVATDLLVVDGRIDSALLRGAGLVQQRYLAATQTIRIGAATRLSRQDGTKLSASEFAALTRDGLPLAGVIFTWPRMPEPATLDGLLEQPAQSVRLLTA